MFNMNPEFWQFAGTGLLTFIAAAIALRLLPTILDSVFDRVPGMNRFDKTAAYFLSDSLGIGFLIMLGVFTLSRMPVDGRIVALVVTVASGAFIFTSEGWAQDALAGISLQLYPQYRVGEWITVGEERRGRVMRVGLFRTFLSTLDLDIISIKNSKILAEDVINHSGIEFRRVRIILHTAGYGVYGNDIRAYKVAVGEIAQVVQDDICPEASLKRDLHPQVYFLEFGSSSDHIFVSYYTYDQDEKYSRAVDAMHTALAETLRPQGVVLGQVNATTIDNFADFHAPRD